ncbi:MAG: M1 family metallopeptidase, partial [Planctomycetota bacterium]
MKRCILLGVSSILVWTAVAFAQTELGQPHPKWSPKTDHTHFERVRQLDVRHLRLDVRVSLDEERVTGSATLEVASRLPSLKSFWLDAVALLVEDVLVDGERARFWVLPERLYVELPEPKAEGEAFTVRVDYAASPETGLLWVRQIGADGEEIVMVHSQGQSIDHRHWFPCHDATNDLLTSEVVVSVPDGYLALSNGALQDVEPGQWPAAGENGERTFHWRQAQPHPNYLITLVIGQFNVGRDEALGVPLGYFAPKGRGEYLEPTFSRTPEMMRVLTERFGVPYPWDRYDQVVALGYESGGMENTGQTTLWEWTLIDESELLERSPDGLLVHELAHQWFGDLVTAASWSDLWINEGFATYSEILWLEDSQGREAADWERYQSIGWYFDEDSDQYRRPIVTRHYDSPDDLFDSTVYPKAAWVIAMLRNVIGDESFFTGMRRFLEEHRHQPVRTEQLVETFEEVSGTELGWFFDQWLRQGGHPELKIRQQFEPQAGVLALDVEQVQDREDGTPIFRFPVEIRVETESGVQRRVELISERHQAIFIPCGTPPIRVRFDAGHRILKRMDFEKPISQWEHQLDPAHEPHVLGRRDAAEAISRQLADTHLREVYATAVSSEPFAPLRAEMMDLIGTAASKPGASSEMRQWAGKLLRERLASDEDPRVRRAAVRALGSCPASEENVTAVRKALIDRR